MQENLEDEDLLSDLVVEPATPSDKLKSFLVTVGNAPKIEAFVSDAAEALSLHIKFSKFLREFLSNRSLSRDAGFFVQKHEYELFSPIKEIEDSYESLISVLSRKTIQREIERKHNEFFPSEPIKEHKKEFCRVKICFEYISSFLKISIPAWMIFESRLKELKQNPETALLEEKIKEGILNKIKILNQATEEFLSKLGSHFHCEITGTGDAFHHKLMSNLIYKSEENYNLFTLFNVKEHQQVEMPEKKTDTKNSDSPVTHNAITSYKTRLIGTKEWNRNDSYILEIKQSDLKKEYEKFDSSSFVALKPGEFDVSPTLASAMVRKNSGHSQRQKFEQIIRTLFEFITSSLIEKDFPKATDDSLVFLYHIGPNVIYNIIFDDMTRRNFGHIYYVEKNSLVKIFPEHIVKYLLIGYWNETFMEMTPARADSYIHFSKGVQFVRNYYKALYDQGAATRKGLINEIQDIDDYMKENSGKFFGYRRIQAFRRFVPSSIFGDLPENSSFSKI